MLPNPLARKCERPRTPCWRAGLIPGRTTSWGYRPKQASELTTERSEQSLNALTVAPWVTVQANDMLRLQWSPEQVASGLPVSHETLSQQVSADKTQGGTLWKNLSCQKQKRKCYARGRDRRGQSTNRKPFSERPEHIAGRKQVGYWECDTVIGANHKQAIVTLLERKSGYAAMAKASHKVANLVRPNIIEAHTPSQVRVKTLTYDNDKEFFGPELIEEALKSTGYFARPFGSWERGSNENFNSLLRQYVPRKRPMKNINGKEIKMIENRLNNRPRKRLGFRTPAEVFHQS